MYREARVSRADLPERVSATSRGLEALGAYASDRLVRYLFLEKSGVLALVVDADERRLPSLTPALPLLDWHEREMREKYELTFDGHPDDRALFAGAIDGGRPVTAQGPGVGLVVVGPVHAGIIEPGRFTFSTGGETVVYLDAQLGFSHRDLERSFEGQDAGEAAQRIARICGGCSVARSVAYARALEYLAEVEISEASELSRVVFAELERLYNHIFDLGSSCAGTGFGRGHTLGLGLKERVLALCARFGEQRIPFDVVRPGGVRHGVLREPLSLRSEVHALRSEFERFTDEVFDNGSVLRRFEGAGMLDRAVARTFGAVGPTSRASCGTTDVRAYSPYGSYRNLEVRTARAEAGDVLARCAVKREEMMESFRLVDDALTAMGRVPPGAPVPVMPAQGVATTAVEGPRGAETVSIEVNAHGQLRRLHVISASYRNWPLVGRAMEGNIIPDFPLVNKSFNLCYSCADR